MDPIFSTLAGILASFWMGALPSPSFNDSNVQWNCQQANWTRGPSVSGGQFHGTIEVDCAFDAVAGVGFTSLHQYIVDSSMKQAKTVHAGPKDVTFAGMPGTYLDLTTVMSSQGETITLRADVNLATDGASRYVSSAKTKSASGTGQANLIRKLDLDFEIEPKGGQHYALHAASTVVVNKPGLVPAGIFRNQVVKMVEDNLPAQEQAIIEDVANHL